jgi:hypothetical protein
MGGALEERDRVEPWPRWLPRRASAHGQGDNLYIHLEWGSALILHHGLAISSKVLDPNPFPTNENSVSYYPLSDGAYLFHDIH